MRLVEYPPPNIAVQSPEEIQECATVILDRVIKALTGPATNSKETAGTLVEADPREIIFRGSLEEVNEFFREKRWSDGLPIIPPTIEAVEEMLNYTDRDPDEALGILPPKKGEATVWNVAVNGVIAGCRPEYMPVLLAVAEAIAEPAFGLQRAGSTGGATPLVIINGPIIKELDFNYGQGVLRPERQANITVARFLRLCMVTIAGYSTGLFDMATFGRNYFPVLAEAEDESPWEPLSVELGFEPGCNIVTLLHCIGMSLHFKSIGPAPDHLRVLAKETARQLTGAVNYLALHGSEACPLVGLSPLVASRIAAGGHTRRSVKEYLFENARIPASEFDEQLGIDRPGLTACEAVKSGQLPPLFGESQNPNRMLPVVRRPDEFLIVVTGDRFRNRSFVTAQKGLAVSKEIKLP